MFRRKKDEVEYIKVKKSDLETMAEWLRKGNEGVKCLWNNGYRRLGDIGNCRLPESEVDKVIEGYANALTATRCYAIYLETLINEQH